MVLKGKQTVSINNTAAFQLIGMTQFISDLSIRRTFDDVFNPIEKITVPLQYAYKSVKHLSLVKKKTFSDPFEGVSEYIQCAVNFSSSRKRDKRRPPRSVLTGILISPSSLLIRND